MANKYSFKRIDRETTPDRDKIASYIHDLWKMKEDNQRKKLENENEDEYIERQLDVIHDIKNDLIDKTKDQIISKLGLKEQEKKFKENQELFDKEQKRLNDQIGYDTEGGRKTRRRRRKTKRRKTRRKKTKRRRYRK